jgi:hypothetical protein
MPPNQISERRTYRYKSQKHDFHVSKSESSHRCEVVIFASCRKAKRRTAQNVSASILAYFLALF